MLSLFNSLSRLAALSWYTATRLQQNVADLMLWQMDRSPFAYLRMHANYRPSALQLMQAHSSIIYWMPFPTTRDKLILPHSANPFLDQIICDIASAYAAEVDPSKLLVGETGPAYIPVLGLVAAFTPAESDGDSDSDSDGDENDSQNDDNPNRQRPPRRTDTAPTPASSVGPDFIDSQLTRLPAPNVESLFKSRFAKDASRPWV